jgi:hypothetical protein
VEWILLVVESWWWVVPAAAGAGTATYVGLTTRTRRARRLELDAARYEVGQAQRALIAARARVTEAQAKVLETRAGSPPPVVGSSLGAGLIEAGLMSAGLIVSGPGMQAKRELLDAKRAEKSASLTVRATRTRVKAISAQYHAASAADPLPIERLVAAHDAVLARWMAYETDVDKAMSYPRMTDASAPATLAFLRAQRDAQAARPSVTRGQITPQQFLRYRDAVRVLQSSFDEAERHAGAARHEPPQTASWPIPGWAARRPTDAG